MFEVVTKAKLTPPEFARIVGVSRIAAYNWINGRTSPHKLLRPKVDVALRVLAVLVKDGRLPLPTRHDAETRKAKIGKIQAAVDKAAKT